MGISKPWLVVLAFGASLGWTAAADAASHCERGQFKSYYQEGEPGWDPADFGWTGRVFELSQDYPDTLPPKEEYPWLAIPFENGGPTDPEAYLQALLDYGLEGNVENDFVAQKNTVRPWYGMPWMDWNTEVAADWPGTDGREFVNGFTHEFDTNPKTLAESQTEFADTWSGAYFNDRAGYGIGQVWCHPNDPDLDQLNPDPTARNNFGDGAYIIKLLFSTISDEQLPTMVGALEWDANIFEIESPRERNKGPLSKFKRKMGKIRMLQIDVAVRDDRSLTGWLFGTFGYDGRAAGATAWDRMVPLGIQWGNNPELTFNETCPGGDQTKCGDGKPLTQQWIDQEALRDLATPPISFDHLGFGGRLAGPVDNPQASCMGCHQTAGFPPVALLPEFAPGWNQRLAPGGVDLTSDDQAFRLLFQANTTSGVIFSTQQLATADYSLQLSMSVINFMSLNCRKFPKPKVCQQLVDYVSVQTDALAALFRFGVPGPGGGPLPNDNGGRAPVRRRLPVRR